MTLIRIFIFTALFLPFVQAPLSAADNSEVLSQFRIDGIMYDSKEPSKSVAMVNSLALRLNDEYRDFKVAEISQDHIMLISKESGEAFELTPGQGKANVQKREGWNPLKDLELPKLPDGKKPPVRTAAGAAAKKPQSEADKAAADALKKLNPFNTLYESKAKVEKQIDEIKAVQNERIDLLNNIMDGMEPGAADQQKKAN